eukprot:1196024-Prorocentrum_minimum.AAC.2
MSKQVVCEIFNLRGALINAGSPYHYFRNSRTATAVSSDVCFTSLLRRCQREPQSVSRGGRSG